MTAGQNEDGLRLAELKPYKEISMITEYPATHQSFIGLNEVDLVRAAQKGDLEAFNRMVLYYQEKVFNLALRILGDEDSAADITQNTFLAAYRGLAGFRNGSFRFWLYRIATNACIDEIRRHKKNPLLSLEEEDEMEERSVPFYGLAGLPVLPEKEYERHEFEQGIQQAFDQLDTNQRTVVVLVDLLEFDYREAAQMLGLPMGTVKSRLARARLRLRYLLSDFLGIQSFKNKEGSLNKTQ